MSTSSIRGGAFALLSAPAPPPALSLDGINRNKTEIAIVGAGPSGLLTACLLKKADPSRDVKIFDGRDRPVSFFGSFPVVLNKRGQTALEQLGPDLIAKARELGRSVDEFRILSGETTVASVGAYGLCIMRDQLVGLLLEMADRMEVPIFWKHKITAIDTGNRSALFERINEEKHTPPEGPVAEPQNNKPRKITVPIGHALVGADGNYSRVRRECETTHHLLTSQESEWGIQMRYLLAPNPPSEKELPPFLDGSVHYVLGANGYVCQQPDGDWSVSLSITDDSDGFMTSDDPSPENIAKLEALFKKAAGGRFADWLLTSDESYASFFRHRVFGGTIVRCSTLAPTNWIALVGDAAHAVAPYTGEGVNSALESATVLAETLAANNHKTCDDYDAARRTEAHALHEYALRNRTIVAGSPSPKWVNTFGTIVLSVGKKIGWVRAVVNDYMLGAKAKERDPVPYTELVAMDQRQRRFLDPLGYICFYAASLIYSRSTTEGPVPPDLRRL